MLHPLLHMKLCAVVSDKEKKPSFDVRISKKVIKLLEAGCQQTVAGSLISLAHVNLLVS